MNTSLAPGRVTAPTPGGAVRRGALALTTGIAACFGWPVLASAATDPPSRYAVQAELRPLALSDDGRFAVDASARHAPAGSSADRRYAVKTVHAPAGDCGSLPDPLFSNGFEGP